MRRALPLVVLIMLLSGTIALQLRRPRSLPPVQPSHDEPTHAQAKPAAMGPDYRGTGQNVLYGDGHVDWTLMPYADDYKTAPAWRDNIYPATTQTKPESTDGFKFYDIMLPSDR